MEEGFYLPAAAVPVDDLFGVFAAMNRTVGDQAPLDAFFFAGGIDLAGDQAGDGEFATLSVVEF
jgi:hypothetical protein